MPNPINTITTNVDSPTSVEPLTSLPPDIANWLHSPRQSAKFPQKVFWLGTLVSLALHGLLMLVPLGPDRKSEPVKLEEKKVRISQLPTPAKTVATKLPPVKVPPKVTPVMDKPALVPPIQAKPIIPPVRSPKPAVETPKQQTPAQTPAQTPNQPEKSVDRTTDATAWEDFPQYPGAQSGCYNKAACKQTVKGLSDVSAFFEKELPAKKYDAKLTSNDSNRKVYQVSRNGLLQFLSLLVDKSGTLYVLSDAPLALADLANAIEVPAEISSVLGGLQGTDATPTNFTQSGDFFVGSSPRPEIGIMQVVTGETPDAFFDTYFRTNLVNNGFEPPDTPQQYGGGLLYAVKREKISLFINLVPTADKTGTVVVIWKNLPK